MAVQIKELIIKAICGENKDPKGREGQTPKVVEASGGKLSFSQRKQIIDECTAEVLDRLKRMNEF